jgi:hypothetical protein
MKNDWQRTENYVGEKCDDYILRSRYSDWLRAGRQRGRSLSLGRVKNFLFSTSSRPFLGPIQLAIQWVPGALPPGVKRSGRKTDHSPQTSAEVKKIYILKLETVIYENFQYTSCLFYLYLFIYIQMGTSYTEPRLHRKVW